MNGKYKPYNGGSKKYARKRERAYGGKAARDRYFKSVEIRLTLCLALAAAFSVCRLVFPAFFADVKSEVSEAIGINADFKSAALVIGEAVNGEKSPGDAFYEACSLVFGSGGDYNADEEIRT